MNASLQNKRILVTGATSGIGRVTVEQLLESGAAVTAIGRDDEALNHLQALGCRVAKLDICDSAALEAAIESWGTFDGLVNSAGVTHVESALSLAPQHLDTLFQTNARAAAIAARCVARAMIAAGRGGSIVNVSSQASLVALEGHLAYSASKAALDAITRTLCLELGPHGIRVNGVHPTVTMTPMAQHAWSDEAKRAPMLAAIPLGRFAEPIEVARPILFLLSEDAAMISGINLPIDGGYTCR